MQVPPQWPAVMMPAAPTGTLGPKMVAIFLGLGLFVGLLALHVAILLPRPNSFQSTDPDVVNYIITVRALTVTSMVALDAAVAFGVTVAYWGGAKPEMSEASRRGPVPVPPGVPP